MVYATVSDITASGYTLTAQQQEAAEVLLETASAKLRLQAKRFGKDIDEMIASDEDYILAVKSAVISSVMRAMNSIGDTSPPATQISQSGLGYTASMTYLNSGQSLYFLRNELKELGLMRQSYGALEVFG
jgi:hypothetical protein|nr:MAG TPA: hypothetical protein [Caudoviricetes sp.]